jgi:hypothetical protein
MTKSIYENHHITPRCFLRHKPKEFINRPENIIRITHKQHIAVHKWLAMLTQDYRMYRAWIAMDTGKFSFDQTDLHHSSQSKSKISKAFIEKWKDPSYRDPLVKMKQGETNPFFGKHHNKKTKKTVSDKAKIRCSNPNEIENYRNRALNSKTPELAEFISNHSIQKWKNPEFRNRTTKNIILAMQDKDLRKRLSDKAKHRVKQQCPYCGIVCDISNYNRWHGNKCKLFTE